MPKTRNLSPTYINSTQSPKRLPAPQQITEEKDQDPPPPRSSQLTVYEVVTLLAFLAGITLQNLTLIFLSCFMAIAPLGPSITRSILLLIKGVFFPKKN